jgi:prepilin-type N-terminal cleavage/methylation domain-containing protein
MKYLRAPVKPSQTGFTFIELLVVIIMIGVLAAIAAPGMQGFLARQRMNAVRSDLVQTLRNTQQDAIQRRQTRQVRVIDNATAPTIEFGPLGIAGFSQTLGDDVANRGQLSLTSHRVVNGNPDDSVDTIAFDYRGLPTVSENLPFVINITTAQSALRQCVIVANLLGSIKTATGADCDNPNVSLN